MEVLFLVGYAVRGTQRVMNARLEVILVAGSWIKERGILMCGALVSAQGCVIFGISFCFTFLEREIL